MEDFLLVVILIILFVRWIILSGKLSRMAERIDYLSGNRADPELIKRIFALETAVQELRAGRSAEPTPAPVMAPPVETPAAERQPVPRTNFCPLCGRVLAEGAVCQCRTIESLPEIPREAPPPLPYFTLEPEPEPVSAPPLEEIPVAFTLSAAPAGPSFSERVRDSMKGEEWEAIIGGSWLNKLGVFVLVIGDGALGR